MASHLYRYAYQCLPACFPIRDSRGVVPRQVPKVACVEEETGCEEEWEEEPLEWKGTPKTGNYYILNNAPCMAVLTENLFMTNIKDTAFLLTESGRDLLAQIHIDAIDAFLGFGE